MTESTPIVAFDQHSASVGASRFSIVSRTVVASSLPSISTGIFAGSSAPPEGRLVTFPGMS
jgi:hypothetical protein